MNSGLLKIVENGLNISYSGNLLTAAGMTQKIIKEK